MSTFYANVETKNEYPFLAHIEFHSILTWMKITRTVQTRSNLDASCIRSWRDIQGLEIDWNERVRDESTFRESRTPGPLLYTHFRTRILFRGEETETFNDGCDSATKELS